MTSDNSGTDAHDTRAADWEPITTDDDPRLTDVPEPARDADGNVMGMLPADGPDPHRARPGDVFGDYLATEPPAPEPMWRSDDNGTQAVVDELTALTEQQRAQLDEPAANVVNGSPHFLRNIDGVERCGQDGEEWPCRAWQSLEEGAAQGAATAAPAPADDPGLKVFRAAAEAAGVDPAELDTFLASQRDRR